MIKKILGVVLILIAVATALLLTGDKSDETTKTALQDAVYLEDAKVRPENEGRIVIVPGKPVLHKKATDPDFNRTFDSPFVRRAFQVQKRKEVKSSDGGTRYKWVWESTSSIRFRGKTIQSRSIYGSVKVGDFYITGNFLSNMGGATSNHKISLGDNLRAEYVALDISEAGEKTFVGIQKDNVLSFKNDQFTGQVYNGILSKSKLEKKSAGNSRMGVIFGYIVCLAMAGGGFYLFRSN